MPLRLNGPPEICSHWLILMGFTTRQWRWGSPGRSQGRVSLPLTGLLGFSCLPLHLHAPSCSCGWASYRLITLLWWPWEQPGQDTTQVPQPAIAPLCSSVCVETPFLRHSQMCFAFWSATQGWVASRLHQEWYVPFTYDCKWKKYKAVIAIAVRHWKYTMYCTTF